MFEPWLTAASGRRSNRPLLVLALSFCLHVLAIEAWFVAKRLHPDAPAAQSIEVLLSGAAPAADAAPLSPEQVRAAARRRELEQMVQPTAVPDSGPAASGLEAGRRGGGADAGRPGGGAAGGAGQVPDAADRLPVEAGGGTTRPELIESTRQLPPYPEEAQRHGLEGEVILRSVIDETGRVAAIEVVRGLSAELDRAAVAAVRKWRFKPATRDGKPVKVYYLLTVNFRL